MAGSRPHARHRAPDSADYARDLAVSHARLGDLAIQTGRLVTAIEHYRHLMELLDEFERRIPGFVLEPGMSNAAVREHFMSQIKRARQMR